MDLITCTLRKYNIEFEGTAETAEYLLAIFSDKFLSIEVCLHYVFMS